MSTTTSARVMRWLMAASLVLFVYLTVALLIAERAEAIAYTGCPGTLTNVDFASSTFSLNAGCALTIDGGSATDLTFTTAHTDLVLVVKNLNCGTGINTPSSCITFASTLTGGSVSVNGLTRTIAGAVSAGEYNLVRFGGNLFSVAVSLRNVKTSLASVTCSGMKNVYAIFPVAAVVGGDFNVSGGGIFGAATVSAGDFNGVRLNSAVTNTGVHIRGITMSRNFIKTYLRIRPDRNGKGSNNAPFEVEHDFEKSRVRFHVDRRNLQQDVVNHSVEDFMFQFNRVLEQSTSQEQLFDIVGRDAVLSVLDGYNSCCFLYGQTGSGKSYSCVGGTGSRAERGLIPRAVSLVYDEIAKRKEFHYSVGISFLQIYNDKGSDLLNRGEDAQSLDDLPPVTIYETDDDVILKGLECHPSATVEDALNLLFLGDTNRLYCETPMNKTSSRSHCVFSIVLEARQHGSAVVRRSKLNIVDLAGSERIGRTGVTGTLQTESKYINLSLHYLEHVISALSEKRDHVPYRNSMLTMVLRDSLGGNCRTVMVATAHPGLDQFWETISTCRFAQRVASIRTECFVNEETDPLLLVRQLRREVAQLKEQVAFLSGGKDTDPRRQLGADEMERCRDLVRRYLDDPECDALSGAGSDLARINACFAIMRDAVKKKGGVVAAASAATPAAHTASAAAAATPDREQPPRMSSEQEQLLREEVRRLKTSLQMKENEMTLLFDLVQRHNSSSNNNSVSSGGDVREQIARQAAAQQQRSEADRSGSESNTPPPPAPPPPQPQAVPPQSESDYNLAALSDPELLKDRTTAFEAFRRSYRKQEQMNGCHAELEQRIGVAKGLAGEINALIERMKAAKGRVQQLRAERALQEDPDKVDPEETRLLDELHSALRPQWTAKTEALKAEKEKIQHLQLIIKRTQEQLIRDFEGWFGARQAQINAAMAGNNTSTASAASSSRSAVSSSVIKPLVQQANNNTSSSSTNSGRGGLADGSKAAAPQTGNAQVDAELQRMYDARAALRARLAANMQ